VHEPAREEQQKTGKRRQKGEAVLRHGGNGVAKSCVKIKVGAGPITAGRMLADG
jgi:hypothetical protein